MKRDRGEFIQMIIKIIVIYGVPVVILFFAYVLYTHFYLYREKLYISSEKYRSHYWIDFSVGLIYEAFLVFLYVSYIRDLILKKRGYVREKVYITRCPYCGYEFKYGVAKYCPNCHHRIWRPYKWVWMKKEKTGKEDGENLKIEGGDR